MIKVSKHIMDKVSQRNGTGKLNSAYQSMKLTTISCPTKINLTWTKDFNVTPEAIELLEENVGGQLLDIGFGNCILALKPKAKVMKMKTDK